jgi:hypothetical protein
MAEKTGNLIKLTYEFNCGWCCEVSFDGESGLELQPVSLEVLMVKEEF